MVAYEDLVVALTNWRINQGLPTGADAFAAFDTSSVDLALPVADPVELSTEEVVALDSDEGIEAEGDGAALETSDGFDSYAHEETALADGADAEMLNDASAEVSQGAESEVPPETGEEDLDFAEDETAYGDMPQMEGMDEMEAVDALGETAIAVPDEFADPDSSALGDQRTEEVDILAEEGPFEEDAEMSVEEMSVEDMSVEEDIDADGMEIEEADDLPVEEVNADEFAVVEEDLSDDFSGDEVPTKFGEEDDSESTAMGVGIDELVPPDEG